MQKILSISCLGWNLALPCTLRHGSSSPPQPFRPQGQRGRWERQWAGVLLTPLPLCPCLRLTDSSGASSNYIHPVSPCLLASASGPLETETCLGTKSCKDQKRLSGRVRSHPFKDPHLHLAVLVPLPDPGHPCTRNTQMLSSSAYSQP